MMPLLLAFQFLTVLPLPFERPLQPSDFPRSLRWFWLVGLLIGLLQYSVAIVLARFNVPTQWSGIAIVCTGYLLTGGLHLDGVADVADGFGAGHDRESILRIMSDARLGVFGVAAIFLILYCKIQATTETIQANQSVMLILAPLGARTSLAITCCVLPYAKPVGKGKLFAGGNFWRDGMISLICCVACCCFLFRIWLPVIASVATSTLFMIYTSHKIRGFTGDILGCQNEIVELTILLASGR